MTTYDFSPLFRSTIGFDRLTQLLDTAWQSDSDNGYPPYNIETVGEDHYRLTLAVAGFGEDDLEIEQHENTLTVVGNKVDTNQNVSYLHRGIAGRPFKRQYRLADFVEVENAKLENGLLVIDLMRRVPDAMKPRKIAIGHGAGDKKQIAA
jgi:molecular chaperone IbpA